jgi:hypothetical protein
VITVAFAHLTLSRREIGCHRGRRWGFRAVFSFRTLQDVPFLHLASRVKRAYDGRDVPKHDGWPAQREALRWLVDRGRDGIYALDDGNIEVRRTAWQTYHILDGNHRALALYILGDAEVRARLK